MKFKNIGDLVNQVNASLGEFCNEFGLKRKELASLGKVPKRGILFTYDPAKENDWAINEGGGTELQYHIAFDADDLEVRYGLGFNTQYVPFANKMSTVEYMQPYMFGFLKNEKKILELLPDYVFVYGNIEQLKKPQNNQYTLFGKSVSVEESSGEYIIEDSIYNDIITDLKKQFQPYQIIFSDQNNFSKVAMNNQNIIDVLMHKGQIVLQGPPGTGKTYTAKDLAEQILFSKVSEDKKEQKNLLESTDQFKMIQFHPAYSYEDFVRGIVAESKGESIEYKTKNKILAEFAKDAYLNWLDSKKKPDVISKEKWFKKQLKEYINRVNNEINDKGEYILNNSKSYINYTLKNSLCYYSKDYYQHKIKQNSGFFIDFEELMTIFLSVPFDADYSTVSLPQTNQYRKLLIPLLQDLRKSITEIPENFDTQVIENELSKYVLIIDEINRANLPAVLGELIYALEYRGEKVESMYPINNDNTLIIPPNLYIIGTMNTSDRSIGHIDYAIRRRFAFIEVLPKVLEGDFFELELFKHVSTLFIQNFDEYVQDNTVELKLSEHLSEEFRPEDVWLGHSYFIKGEGDFSLRKKYEIVPILKEYVKDGILKQSAESIINAL